MRLLDVPAAEVTGTPPPVAAYVDGCQAVRRMAYRQHRPVVLRWAAAAALAPGVSLLEAIAARVHVVCSHLDASWVSALPGGARIVELDEQLPWDLESAIDAEVDETRRSLEAEVAAGVGAPGVVVIDGDLRRAPAGDRFVAVAKTHAGQYLTDEAELFDLPAGWRSRMFVLPASRRGEADRYSAYVRLFDASSQWWGFGLVRVEARTAVGVDHAASVSLANRQPLGTDRRENHLASIAAVERFLVAQRPGVFDV